MAAEQKSKDKSTFPYLLLAGSVLAFVLIVPVLANVIRQIEPGRQKSPEVMAMERGTEIPPSGTFVTAHCPEPCRLGTYVKLIVGRTEKPSWLAAYAEDEGHRRVWYYPTVSGVMPEVAARKDVGVLSEAIKLSDAHKHGDVWTLHLVLVDEKMTREQLEQPDPQHVVTQNELQLVLGEGKR
jgi:hypothetical protein